LELFCSKLDGSIILPLWHFTERLVSFGLFVEAHLWSQTPKCCKSAGSCLIVVLFAKPRIVCRRCTLPYSMLCQISKCPLCILTF
jgi:hypothetical protein